MATPWHGDTPPERPVRITMPYRVAKALLEAVRREGFLALRRTAPDEVRLANLTEASRIIGDAIGAPPHRRFTTRPKP